MERIVIIGYKPFPGMENELRELIKTHVQVLRNENLVTNRKPVIMEAEDGTIVEVFGWKSKEAIEAAHSNTVVQEMWEAFSQVCEYVPVAHLDESRNLFSEFAPLDWE